MGTYHTVVQGEYLAKIARARGFSSWKTIWDAGENGELRRTRESPNILFPGDQLFIPDRAPREELRPTDQRHRFAVRTETLRLRIVLKGWNHRPLAGHDCTLLVEDLTRDVRTQPDGKLDEQISPRATAGLVIDRGGPRPRARVERHILLRIGNLDPVDKVSGQIARLNNLGYDAGEVPDHPLSAAEAQEIRRSPQFLSAVEEFQCDTHLKVDGACGPQTQAQLKTSHGC